MFKQSTQVSLIVLRTTIKCLSAIIKSELKSMKKNIGKGEEKKNEAPPITQFSGYYEFLSIDHPCWVFHEGFLYPSLSIAFQAARTKDSTLRRKISEVK